MNGPVDVLAVLDRHVQAHQRMALADAYSAQEYPKLRGVRAAVSELIDFAQRVEARISALAIVGIDLDNDMQTMLAEARAAIAKATQP